MIRRNHLLSFSALTLAACQAGLTPEQKLANDACADASLQSGCHQMIHGALEAQAEQWQTAAESEPGARRQQHSYLDDFETRPAIIENPIAPKKAETNPREDPPNPEN